MMKRRQGQQGFTLIEVVVVVVIIAIISGFSVFAINQSSDRRYTSRAEDLQAWLRQLADIAMLEGSAYGVLVSDDRLEGLVYYDYRWRRLASPESFRFVEPARLTVADSPREDEDTLTPDIVMLADGYMQPRDGISLSFENFSDAFHYHWDDQEMSLVLERIR